MLPEPIAHVGQDIRALRKGRRLTLAELASRIDRSTGWLSHVERGQLEPGISDLRQIARTFDMPLSMLFRNADAPEHERGFVVRAANRTRLGTEAEGLTEELLSPALSGPFEMIRSIFEPGAESAIQPPRPTTEAAYVVSGRLDIWIGREMFSLGPGDSFQFARTGHRWRNPGTEPAILIWIVAPPVY